MMGLADIARVTGGRLGRHDVACPLCGPFRQPPLNQRRRVMRIWQIESGFATFHCIRCGVKGYARDRAAPRSNGAALRHAKIEAADRERIGLAARLSKARWLWSMRMPNIVGTIAETYLRTARAYGGPIPPTLGFLPANERFPAALIAAFGVTTEPKPGVLNIADDAVVGVHLVKLRPDGSDRLRDDPKCKITVGTGFVAPIVVASHNDLLGTVIAEGIEDALNAHEASGLGAWAAGTATRLPALAGLIPSYIEVVTILVDDDAAGRTNSQKLMARLQARGIEVRLTLRGSFS
jgi:Toprim domain